MDSTKIAACQRSEEDTALRLILEGTASELGNNYFDALVQSLSRALNTCGAWVTEYLQQERRLRALAFWLNGSWIHDFQVDIDGTPCQRAIDRDELVHYADNILELFPKSRHLRNFGVVSYMGVPLKDMAGAILGHMAVIGDRPMPLEQRLLTIFRIFADRAAAELQRLRADGELREQQSKLRRLFDGAMEGIVELDDRLNVTRANQAAGRMLGLDPARPDGANLAAVLTPDGRDKLVSLIRKLNGRASGGRQSWIDGRLLIVRRGSRQLETEATLSRIDQLRGQTYLLMLRDLSEKIATRKRIQELTRQAEYLEAEIHELEPYDRMIGRSLPMRKILNSIRQVGPTQATVLIQGETGTGKELVAHLIHSVSPRAAKPFIKINCAALPAGLVESELFGHEAGAYTGADRRRKGRFELADGGTILLDEIGELPLALQSKLLRVLQEMQFERVGGTELITVDVRVLAAANRDLTDDIIKGRFRADLYYRLNVYPIQVPPLREHMEDVPLLTAHFVPLIASRIGKQIHEVPDEVLALLSSYHWPGNVRELKNVLERAVITSSNGIMQLAEGFGGQPEARPRPLSAEAAVGADLATMERAYIQKALETTGGRISGEKGAARILGLNPSTLRFRMKKMGIVRTSPSYLQAVAFLAIQFCLGGLLLRDALAGLPL